MENDSLWNVHLAFPLKRLHDLIHHSDNWSDAESELMWNHRFRDIPYQLWNTNPFHGGALHLQNVHMTCPTCDEAVVFDLHQFTAMHVTKKSTIQCPRCYTTFDTERLSAKHLVNDLRLAKENFTAVYVYSRLL
jgi:hypothetical protein